MQTLNYVLAALAAIQALSDAGQKISGILNETQSTLAKAQAENREPTTEEKAALDKVIEGEMAILDNAKA